MGKVSIAGREFEVDVVSDSEQATVRFVVEYETGSGDRLVERSTLPADSRSAVTPEAISAALSEWAEGHDVVDVHGFAVLEERVLCSGGEAVAGQEDALLVDPSDRDAATARSADDSAVSASRYVEGDHLVYYEGGPDSAVYGYTTDGIVAEAPPIEHQHRANEPDKIRLDVGGRTKIVPLSWVVGHADEFDDPIDNPRDL